MRKIFKIRTGGQSGVDRAAMDVARSYQIPLCGWCPKGGWAEDYPNPPGLLRDYPEFTETEEEGTRQRTLRNMRDCDAILTIWPEETSGSEGTKVGLVAGEELNKPMLTVKGIEDLEETIRWLETLPDGITLSVGGPRASECHGAYEKSVLFLSKMIETVENMTEKKKLTIMAPLDEAQKDRIIKASKKEFTVSFTNPKDFHEKLESYMDTEVIVGEPDIEDIHKLPKLSWIQMTWAGTDKYTRNPGFPWEKVLLTNASGAFGVIISEYVLAGILSLYRNFPRYLANQKDHLWKDGGAELSLFGKRALILGTGDIGSETTKRLKAFEVTTVGLNTTGHGANYFDETLPLSDIKKELPKADLLIGAIPNHKDTIGLLGKEEFSLMKETAVFVNVGRGLLVKPGALEEALEEKRILGAVLDVHAKEPLDRESPLWDMDQVIITPHIAGPSFLHCKDTENRIWDIFTDNLKRYLSGQELKKRIKKEVE